MVALFLVSWFVYHSSDTFFIIIFLVLYMDFFLILPRYIILL